MRTSLSNGTGFLTGLRTDRIERFVALARGVVGIERAWPALWPASGIVGVWIAAGLFGLFTLLPAWLHLLLLLGFLAGIAALLWRQFEHFAWPQWRDGARRLERDSTLLHRPISEGDDVIALGRGDPYAETLWRAHLRALLARIGDLHLRWPHPDLAAKDPHALRFGVLLLLLAGFLVAGRAWPERIASAFVPAFGSGAVPTLDAWINPPAYTGQAPVYLARGDAAVSVPAGSRLVLRVHGADAPPRLDLDWGRAQFPAFSRAQGAGDREFANDVALTRSGTVSVVADGRALGRWHVNVLPDLPPSVRWAATPARTPGNAVKFVIAGTDDYGIVKLTVTMTPTSGMLRTPLVIDLPVDNSHTKILNETAYQDLTAHPYAGAQVSATVTATDGAGQSATSAAIFFTLPQRVFTDPLARALAEQRRNLVLGDVVAIPNVQRALEALTIAPDKFMADKPPSAYLALRSAYWALRNVREREDIVRVEDLLWGTALALDQNGAALLAEQLRRLQAMLTQALANGASPDQIEELLQRYAQVLNEYLALMAQNAQPGGPNAPPSGTKTLGEKDLQDMLKAIQQLAETGARGEAAQMLAMLQALVENLHFEASKGGSGEGSESAQDKAAGEAVKKLGDLMGQQRELLDKTYRESQDEGNPADGGAKGLAQRQGQLKDGLGEVMRGLGQGGARPPKNLGDAGREMGEAQGELGQKDFGTAAEAQKRALDDMRKGVGELASRLQNAGKNGAKPGSQDPFGRPQGAQGSITGGGVKIPDKSTLARAREILQELRKRAGERGRPQEELDYIDRLLKQF